MLATTFYANRHFGTRFSSFYLKIIHSYTPPYFSDFAPALKPSDIQSNKALYMSKTEQEVIDEHVGYIFRYDT